MNINKDGKTLYFSDEEIDNDIDGQKKVFVTKRINGKESHTKVSKRKKNAPKHLKNENKNEKEEKFNFNNEIVIGVNVVEKEKKVNNSKNKIKKNNKKAKEKKGRKEKNEYEHKEERKRKKENNEYEQMEERKRRKERIDNNEYKHKEEIKHTKKPKKAKNRKIIKKILAILSSITLVAIVIIFALTAPIFNIANIQIQGNEKIQKETILSLSKLKKGENIFRFTNNDIIQNIKENRYIENVKIKRKLPETVTISVEERTIKYQINLINSYVYIDKNGYILENNTIKQKVPVIVGFAIKEDEMLNAKRLPTKDLSKLNNISKIIDSSKTINIDSIITEINIEKEDDYVLYLETKNKRIHIGDTSNLANKMLYIQKILENEEGKSGIAFVNGDISTGFKPYFREE